MLADQSNPSQEKTICGPYDQEFKRKFVGREPNEMIKMKQNVLKGKTNQVILEKLQIKLGANLLPRVKELEKIAKTSQNKQPKINKYVDGVSDLDLYITKKLMNNQGTQQVLRKMEEQANKLPPKMSKKDNNYLKMTKTTPQFYQKTQSVEGAMQKTGFSHKPTVENEDDFMVEQFNRFVQKKHVIDPQQPVIPKQEENLLERIREDRRALTGIVRNMISDHHRETQYQEEAPSNIRAPCKPPSEKHANRDISWVLKECRKFDTTSRPKFRSHSLKRLNKIK